MLPEGLPEAKEAATTVSPAPIEKQHRANIMAHHRMETVRANNELPVVKQAPSSLPRARNFENPPGFEPSLAAALRQRPQFPQSSFMDELREMHRLTNRTGQVGNQVLMQQRVARMLSESSRVFEQHLRQGDVARRAHRLTHERAKQYIAYREHDQLTRPFKRRGQHEQI